MSINKNSIVNSVRVDEWTAELANIASNVLKFLVLPPDYFWFHLDTMK